VDGGGQGSTPHIEEFSLQERRGATVGGKGNFFDGGLGRGYTVLGEKSEQETMPEEERPKTMKA